jgi:hypothetical protein
VSIDGSGDGDRGREADMEITEAVETSVNSEGMEWTVMVMVQNRR